MKVFCHVPRENWIVDRMGKEYQENSSHTVSLEKLYEETRAIWLFASWCWRQIPVSILKNPSMSVLCTIHHEVPWKFNEQRKREFVERDKYVDVYHTYTKETKSLINSISKKPVHILPHWVNENIWYSIDKIKSKNILNLPDDKFIIGSFQRDTEGSDLVTPKLEKGPDIFLKAVDQISKSRKVHVLLGGWRRQYVIAGLKSLGIDYTYFELPSQEKINLMYNACDLYIVGSRCEGGPQSLFECAITETPIISSRVGQAELLLRDEQIFDIVEEGVPKLNILTDTQYNSREVEKYYMSSHISNYDSLLGEVVNEKNRKTLGL